MKKQKLRFIIDHIDPLGQGVFKENDQIYFIPKTLPLEEGEFEVLQSRRGVNFGSLLSLSKKSDKRIQAQCPHFETCPGCHFQHTSYDNELDFKMKSFKRILSSLSFECEVETIPSHQRYGYRNRIQLHYDSKKEKIGYLNPKKKEIVNITDCIIPNERIQTFLKSFLSNNGWLQEAKKHKKLKGHVEIYDVAGSLQVSWNESYAKGGFTQVNEQTNHNFKNQLKSTVRSVGNALDLFGGNGNLSDLLNFEVRKCIDIYPHNHLSSEFISLNLFEENSLEEFKSLSDIQSFDTFIIDPPRSGFKHIKQWCDHYRPKKIVYVACSPQTMVRDLKEIKDNYKITKIQMIDFFAGTFHFESCVFLEKIG